MTGPQRPEAPGRVPGASSWAKDFNQNTVDIVAAWCRVWSMLWSVATALLLLWLAFTPGWDLALAALLAASVGAAHVWLGFFYLANPEWKGEPDGDE